MKFKIFTCFFILFASFLSVATSHQHSHDGAHHHSHHHHSHEEDVNPSYKYSKQANEQIKANHNPDDSNHNHHGHSHDHEVHHEKLQANQVPEDLYNLWVHSIASTLLISAAPFFILYLVPLDNTESMQPRLKTLLAFASGGLLGDAFLHLIPHSVAPHSHDAHSHSHSHNHSHHEGGHNHDMWVGLWVLGGIIAFLAVEKIVRLLKLGHDHSHGHGVVEKKEPEKKAQIKKKENEPKKKEEEAKPTMEVAGYLNLAADFTHNFTDGLAIGASYLAGNSIGIVTTITILLHEVPHEIGDFAILIKSGCSRKKAMFLQLTTAAGALAGNILALLGASEDSSPWILPFTAGGFIYIATVSVIPELLESNTKLWQSLKEIFALLLGVAMMVLITHLE